MLSRVSLHTIKSALSILLLPLVWLISLTDFIRLISGVLGEKLGIGVPPVLLAFSFILLPAFLYVYLTGDVLKPFILALTIYILPSLFGLRIELLDRYVPGAIVLLLGFTVALFITWLEKDIRRVEGDETSEFLILTSLQEALVPLPLGIMLTVILLWRSSMGEFPRNILPLPFVLPLLLFAILVFTIPFKKDETDDKTKVKNSYLIIRTSIKAGDSFILDIAEKTERSVTFMLSGGFPVERPILLKLKWHSTPPEIVVLKSPWVTRTLLKAEEKIRNGERYIIYLPTFRAPSSPDIFSAPQ